MFRQWRLPGTFLRFLCSTSHSVDRLPVHEFGLQNVVFEEGCEEEALENVRRKNSKLEAFFLLNREDPRSRHLLHTEIISDYTWNNNTRTWHRRRRNCPFTLWRMNSVSPRDQEHFHLRLLLQHIPGPELWGLAHSEQCCPWYIQTGMCCQWLGER